MKRISESCPKFFTLFLHLLSKMHIKVDFSGEAPKMPLNVLPETLIPDYSCVATSNCFIEKLPIHYKPSQNQKGCPFVFKSSNEMSENELSKLICGLANQRFGCILLVDKFEGKVIKSGIPYPTNQELFLFQLTLRKAALLVSRSDMINIRVDLVPVISKFDYLMEETGDKCCIRITIKVDQKSQETFFCQQKPNKSQKTFYHFYVAKAIGEIFVCEEIQKESVYQLISRKRHQKILSEIVNPKLNFSGIVFGEGHSAIQKTHSPISTSENGKENLFNFCYRVLNQDSLQDCFNYKQPSFKEKSIAVVMIKADTDPVVTTRQVRSIFQKSKTKYKEKFPFPKIQREILDHRQKESESDLSLFYVIFYAFEGKYQHFDQEYQKMSKKFREKMIVCELLPTVKVGIPMTFHQVQVVKQMIMKKFKHSPKVAEKPLSNELANVEMEFGPGREIPQMYTYIFLSLCNLRPKLVSTPNYTKSGI